MVDAEHEPTADDDALIAETAAVLDATRACDRQPGRPSRRHRRARSARATSTDAALDASATVEVADGDSAAVMTRVAAAFPLRRLSLLSAALAYNAEIGNGAPPPRARA